MNDVETKKETNSSQRFRWNLLFNFIIWILLSLPFWIWYIPGLKSMMCVWILIGIQGTFQLFFVIVSLFAIKTLIILYINRNKSFRSETSKQESDKIIHIVSLSCYKEPVELIANTIQTLADQTIADQVTMIVGFEEKTPNVIGKQIKLKELFGESFRDFIFFRPSLRNTR